MKECLVRYIPVELKWKAERATGVVLSSAVFELFDALKEGVIVAVLGLNDDRLEIVGEIEFEVLH